MRTARCQRYNVIHLRCIRVVSPTQVSWCVDPTHLAFPTITLKYGDRVYVIIGGAIHAGSADTTSNSVGIYLGTYRATELRVIAIVCWPKRAATLLAISLISDNLYDVTI
jgi:hypothetical protein